ncbi:MAG: hypothetical protein EBV03_05680 [Proteobacteria bacterium]|nr:hypothetical protein [Pseudomonadota bacterium]
MHRKKQNRIHNWNESPYDPVRGEKAMWMAVITQAMMDALSRSSKVDEQYHKHEAIRWLTGNGKDFKMVCILADVDPEYIRSRVKKALAAPRLWRAKAGSGIRYQERKAYRSRIKRQQAAKPMPGSFALIKLPLESIAI